MRIKTRNINVRVRRSVRAISPVISVLMMIAIAVAASLVAYAWVMGYIGGTTNKVGKAVLIQSVAPDADGNLLVYVQNVGYGGVTVDSVYVNNQLMGSGLGVNLDEGETAEIPVAFLAVNVDKVKVATTDGTFTEKSNIQTSTNGGNGGPGNVAPTAAFSFSPTDPETSETVTFTDMSTENDGTIAAWLWDFGDGTPTSSAQSPTHSFSAANTYTVSLTVTDDYGAHDSVTHDVTVSAPAGPITVTQSPTANNGGGWDNEDNAYANGGDEASSNNNNEQCTYSGYGFAIPSSATVTQVRVRLDAWHSRFLSDDDIRLEVYDGSFHIYTPNPISLSGSQTTIWCDVTSLSSGGWTPSEVNGIHVRVTHVQDFWWPDTIYLDWIPIEVTYTP